MFLSFFIPYMSIPLLAYALNEWSIPVAKTNEKKILASGVTPGASGLM